MGNELWREITAAPLNTVVCAGLAGLFFYMWNSRVPLDGFATSYRKTVLERQYYRVLSSAIAHVNALHLVFNVAALWNVGVMMEASRGTAWYARQSVALLVLGQALFLWGAAATRRAIALGSLPPTWSNDRGAVGYSGVIFGWMTLAAQLQPHAVIPLPFGLPGIPLSFSPFVSLFVTQLLVPAASFGGHGAGIVAGFLISWGWVDAVLGDGYWFWCAATWLCGCAVLSLARADAGDLLPCLARAVVLSPAYSESSSSSGGGASAAGPRGVVGATAEAFRRAFVPTAAAAGAAGSRQAPRRRYMDAAGVLREDRGVDVESGQRGGSSSEESTSASSIPSVAALAAQLRGTLPRWWRGGGAAAPATAAAATAPSLSTGDNVIIPNVLRSGLSSSQRQPTAVPSSSSTSSNGGATSLSASAAATESTSSAPSSSLLQRLRGAVSAAASGASGARGGAYSRVPGAEATMEEEGARGRPDGVGHGAATTTTSLSASASSTEAGGSRSTSNDAATARGRGGRGDDAQQQQPKPPVLIVNGGEAVKATTTTTAAADSPGLGSSATAGRPTPHPSDWPGSGHESPGGGSAGPHI